MRVLGKPCEPIPHKLEAPAIDVVDAVAARPVVMEQPGRLEHSDVPRGGRPGVLEHLGDLAGHHRSALEVQRKQDPPTRRVGERREHRLVRIHPSLPLLSRSAPGHALIYLARRLSIVKVARCLPLCPLRFETGSSPNRPPRFAENLVTQTRRYRFATLSATTRTPELDASRKPPSRFAIRM